MARKHTTRVQDAAFIGSIFEQATRTWKVGDVVVEPASNNERTTTITAIDGDVITLANGMTMHRSRVRAGTVVVQRLDVRRPR